MNNMFFGLFSCPEWQGTKASDRRPCIVRRQEGGRSWVIPCTTKYHNNDSCVYVSNLKRPSFAVMPADCRYTVNSDEVEVVKDVPEELRKEILWWEITHDVNLLNKEELKFAQEWCFA